jgi:hypothetical protein
MFKIKSLFLTKIVVVTGMVAGNTMALTIDYYKDADVSNQMVVKALGTHITRTIDNRVYSADGAGSIDLNQNMFNVTGTGMARPATNDFFTYSDVEMGFPDAQDGVVLWNSNMVDQYFSIGDITAPTAGRIEVNYNTTSSDENNLIAGVDQFQGSGIYLYDLKNGAPITPLISFISSETQNGQLIFNTTFDADSKYLLQTSSEAKINFNTPASGAAQRFMGIEWNINAAEGGPTSVPEPSVLFLLGSSLLGLAAVRQRAKK